MAVGVLTGGGLQGGDKGGCLEEAIGHGAMVPQRLRIAQSSDHIAAMPRNLYLDTYDEAVDWHLRLDLPAWAELLSRHHVSLRRPYATGRPVQLDDNQLSDDRQQRDGAADREQHPPAAHD